MGGRAYYSPPVERLPEPDAHWCEFREQKCDEGATRRDQRGEENTLQDYGVHILSDNYDNPQTLFRAQPPLRPLDFAVELAVWHVGGGRGP
jgi:hypothetical protein